MPPGRNSTSSALRLLGMHGLGFYRPILKCKPVARTRMPPGRSSATSARRRPGLHDAPLCTRS